MIEEEGKFGVLKGSLGGGAHWALDPREVILKSQILKIGKLAKSYNV